MTLERGECLFCFRSVAKCKDGELRAHRCEHGKPCPSWATRYAHLDPGGFAHFGLRPCDCCVRVTAAAVILKALEVKA